MKAAFSSAQAECGSVLDFRRLILSGAAAASAAVLTAVLSAAPAFAQDLVVYDDALQNGFLDYSYGASRPDFASTVQHHGGTKSIAFAGNDFNAISFAHPASVFTTVQYPTLHFWVHGGTSGGQPLQLLLELDNIVVASAPLGPYIAGGAPVADAWREVTVSFGSGSLSFSGSFDRIDLQADTSSSFQALYIDDVTLVASSSTPSSMMLIEHDVTVSAMVSDRFTWSDGAGKPRVATLAHNRGGAAIEYRYQMPDDSTRVAGVTTYGNGGNGGFGYVVSHRQEGTNGLPNGVDDSPLGFAFGSSFQRVFEGRHHAIFRLTQMYPRHSTQEASPPNTTYMVPVTIDWIFSTGRDNPVWAVTWDLSGVPENALNDDSRAPYGELNIDGTGFTDISGVAWGDRYKFTSTSAPVTLSSSWDWTQPNTVPYVKLWIASTDATMGTVQTQTLTQQDAGAGRNAFYHDLRGNWGFTSAHGNAGEDVMPWQDSWPYQANAFSIGSGVPNNNARLTWGAMYGFLGQLSYATNNGLVANGVGWPKRSYSTYVVLGPHSALPVEAQVAQIETVQTLSLTAALGSVLASGPAGVARADTVTYSPAGYNQITGALSFTAAVNQLDANIAVGAGSLRRPLVVLGNYTSGSYPASVKLGGVPLVSDVDYFPSLRTTTNELWLTLNRDLKGAVNHLEILSSACAPVPATPMISAPSSATPGQTGLTASVASHAGSSTSWSITNGSITSGNGSNQIAFAAGAAGTLSLSAVETNSTGCASAPGTASVSVTGPPPTGTFFHALAPCRLFDTRNAAGPDAAAPALSGLAARTIAIGGRCGLPGTAKALSVNLAITGAAASGTLLLYPADVGSAPLASSVSFRAGQTRANNDVLVLAGDGTGFTVVNSSAGTVHFILDVNGWFE